MDERHGHGCAGGYRLGLMDVGRILELVFYLRVRQRVVHGRESEKRGGICIVVDRCPLLLLFLALGVYRQHFITTGTTDCTRGAPLRFQTLNLANALRGNVVTAAHLGRGYECSCREPRVPFGSSRGEPLGGQDGGC